MVAIEPIEVVGDGLPDEQRLANVGEGLQRGWTEDRPVGIVAAYPVARPPLATGSDHPSRLGEICKPASDGTFGEPLWQER